MIKRTNIFILFLGVLLFAACKKEDIPPSTEGEVVFAIDAIFDNQALDIEAGKNDFYMFTSFEQSANNVYTFTGEIAKDNTCENTCEESLLIEFEYATANTIDINDILKTNLFYEFKNDSFPSNSGFELSLNANVTSANTTIIEWFIDNDTLPLMGPNPSQIYLNQPNSVLLKAIDLQGCESSQLQSLSLNNAQTSSCSADFIKTGTPSSSIIFDVTDLTGTPPHAFEWETPDTMSTDSSVIITSPGLYELTVTDADGCISEVGKTAIFQQNVYINNCSATFNYSLEELVNDINVRIAYTDDSGNFYSSSLGNQGNSVFQILEIEEYELNENGEKVKKLLVEFECTLYSSNGLIKPLNGTAVIGVAYP